MKIHFVKSSEAHRADENGFLSWTPMVFGRKPEANPNLCGRKPARQGGGIGSTRATTDKKLVTCGFCVKTLNQA